MESSVGDPGSSPADAPAAAAGRPPGLSRAVDRTRVLFLCVHNSARSQMAEGLLRDLGSDRFDVASAGSIATEVRPLAIAAMAERGIDISGQHSKTTDAFDGQTFDYVVNVCDDAREACPYFPGAIRRLSWSFEDPSAATGDDGARLAVFRRVRDEIEARIRRELIGQG